MAAEEFEKYLHTRYIGKKRFSVEGGESLIPLLNTIIEHGAELGAEKVIIAMAHRGRLNALAHVLNKPYEVILSEFEETNLPPDTEGDGDVKYHLGYGNTRSLASGKKVKVSLLPNPSHLELIDPIQQGIVRCQQEIAGDKDRTRVVPVTIHGDASFTGQGIIPETLNLSELSGFRTGGTIHVIVNNQVGFTTAPRQGRFTPYPTDVAKMIQAPIFHVNGDDPEAVVWAGQVGDRVPAAVQVRRVHRHVVLPPARPQRDRRAGVHPAGHVPPDQGPQDRSRQAVPGEAAGRGQGRPGRARPPKKIVTERLDQARTSAQEYKPRMKVPAFSGVWKGMGKAGADWSAKTAVAGTC